MSSPARVLYVDDDCGVTELVAERLERYGELSITAATSVGDGND